jgi:hypothetical protein
MIIWYHFLIDFLIWSTYDKNITKTYCIIIAIRHKKRTKDETNWINYVNYKRQPSNKNTKNSTLMYTTPKTWLQFSFISTCNKYNNISFNIYIYSFVYRFCSNLPPLSERTVRNELNTSCATCPAVEYVFNSVTVVSKVIYDKICISWIDQNNNPYLRKHKWTTKNDRYKTKHNQSQSPVNDES